MGTVHSGTHFPGKTAGAGLPSGNRCKFTRGVQEKRKFSGKLEGGGKLRLTSRSVLEAMAALTGEDCWSAYRLLLPCRDGCARRRVAKLITATTVQRDCAASTDDTPLDALFCSVLLRFPSSEFRIGQKNSSSEPAESGFG